MSVPYLPSRIGGRMLAGCVMLATFTTAALAAVAATALASPQSPQSLQAASGGSPAPAPGQISWSVMPATATAPQVTRVKFNYLSVTPGSTITDHVAVINRGGQGTAFSIYATDATGTTAENALTLLPAGARPTDIGSWVTFASSHGRPINTIIPGRTGVIETFTISVPRNATPGDHTGGVIASVGVPHKNASGQMVTLYQRVAVPLELRVTGPLHAGLTVQSISTSFGISPNPFGGGSAKVSYTVKNTGNVRIAGTQAVKVNGPFGMSSVARLPRLPTILPGDSIRFTANAAGLYPAGPFTAHVSVTPGWPPAETPLALRVPIATGSASLFAIPWALLGVIILLAGGGFGGWWFLRWRRRTRNEELAAAVEKARKDTERRLLGGTATSGAKGTKAAHETN